MRRAAQPETDLFVAAAEAARAEAAKRWRTAPRGEVGNRLRAFQAATKEALRAALEVRP